ncbi:uncharacterized protein PV07_08047 [Cladophialophora immunda]|uniref:Uncharacterized protein n=1 Tax=Cladophialophora immunda TaxID=569365 RepID=A0A0D2CXP7_9EURO|nr:uncharacterized protein PV07_08047 [Cladophialophora immunda]KIW28379.1 hypothetical protein PV07_08047 [Cladophialophora immunda]OQV03512.1 hypothetical protein CLAIMM_08549 [Cladophialophora immunda]
MEEISSGHSSTRSRLTSHSTSSENSPNSLSWWTRMSLDNWLWELSAALLCICILAAIAAILFVYDNRPVPDLPDGLTINAIVSLLAGFAKAALLAVLASAIRQEKWLWFIGKPRPLNTVDAFEEASRGPYGSILLILSRRGSLRALVAALVTVLALGFEPFLQQVLNTVVRDSAVPSQPASIRTPTSYNESVSGNLGGSGLSLNALIGAFGGAAGAIPNPICPSGNCTWPAYNTLAMCTMCTDMTDKVKLGGDVYNINLTSHFEKLSQSNQTSSSTTWTPTYSFPHGNPVNVSVNLDLSLPSAVEWFVTYPRRVVWPLNIDPAPDSHWGKSWDNKSYAGISSPLFAMGYLDINTTSSFDQLVVQAATECAFTPCVRTMDTVVRSGSTISHPTATDYGTIIISQNQPDGRILTGWNADVNGTTYFAYDAGNDDSQGRAYLLIQALRMALEGNTTYSYGGYWYSDPAEQGDIFNFSSTSFDQVSGPWSSAGQQAIDGNGNFSDVVNSVGRALTGRFQQLQDTVATGTTLHSEAVIVVRWEWISYPLALVVLGLAGLFLTMFSTHRNHMAVWKESTLPLLFRYTAPVELQQAHSTPGGLARPDTTFSFSNAIPSPDSNKVSSIVTQASEEQVQLRRRDSFWVLDSDPKPPGPSSKDNLSHQPIWHRV